MQSDEPMEIETPAVDERGMPLPPAHGNPGGRESMFGRAVRAARLERRMSQRELAQRVHLDPTAVTRIETGERQVRLEEAVALADALDLSLDIAARWFPDSGAVQFAQYEHLARIAMLQARRELVRALRFGDMAVNGLIGDEEGARVLAEHGARSFSELWESVAEQMEAVWRTPDPVVNLMQCITYDDEDSAVKKRLIEAVTHDLLVREVDLDMQSLPGLEGKGPRGEHPEA